VRMAEAAYPRHYPRTRADYRRFYQTLGGIDFIGAGPGAVLGVCQSFPAARAEFLPLRGRATGYFPDEGLGLRLSSNLGNDNEGLFIFCAEQFGNQCGRYCFVSLHGGWRQNPDYSGRPGHRPAFILGCPRFENRKLLFSTLWLLHPTAWYESGFSDSSMPWRPLSADLFHFPDKRQGPAGIYVRRTGRHDQAAHPIRGRNDGDCVQTVHELRRLLTNCAITAGVVAAIRCRLW